VSTMLRRDDRRIAAWVAFIAFIAIVQYTAPSPPKNVLYRWDNAIGSAVQYAFFFGIVLLIAIHRRDLFALRRPRSWPAALGTSIVVLVSVYAVTGIVSAFLDVAHEQGLTPTSWDSSRALPFAANVVVVCAIAPFVEEVMFRGVGFSLIAERFGAEPAIVATGVAFGLYHGLVLGLPILIAFGIGLAWLRDRQNSTIPGMVLHATFNAIALAASLLT
jgi:membrane protease YdiL (CAAX protease family)